MKRIACARPVTISAFACPDAAILDFSLPDGDGLELLEHCKSIDENLPVIVLTGQGSIELAVRAIKQGAEQFLIKPIELPALYTLLVRALENKRHRQHSLIHQSREKRERLHPFVGDSKAIRNLGYLAGRLVTSVSPILIQGETGTGKGVLAKWIHDNSDRGQEGFMDLNCAGLEREFLETELFGHAKGAFTGAVQAKPGLLDVADKGTVFLDEIGDMDLTVQPKLLKVLETKQFRRLGDVHDRTVDIRLISATHRNLKDLVRQGRFREDLFFRINIMPIRIPPLRERPEDIPQLSKEILGRIAAERGCGEIELDDAAVQLHGELLLAGKYPRDAQRAGARGTSRSTQPADGAGPGIAISGWRLGQCGRQVNDAVDGDKPHDAADGSPLHCHGPGGGARLD